jgi:cytidine deaminase
MNVFDSLFESARRAQANAYAPYSRFKVGAAVRAPSGGLYGGCNVENASYPVGLCAEAAAIAAMARAGETRICDILIYAEGEALTTPCGACRQRIREFADAATRIHTAGPEGLRRTFTMDELLPLAFGPDVLPKG